jgi:hypothetical protein
MTDTRIFVQIPAYRDTELAPTLIDLYAKSKRPKSLRVVVLWQRAPEDTLPQRVRQLPNLEIIDVPFWKSRGCNWARSVIQKRWREEPYTLFIDSHHRFKPAWDQTLVRMHGELEAQGIRKPVLTAYLPPYDPATRQRSNVPYKIYPKDREAGLLIHLTSYQLLNWDRLTRPEPANFVSGAFIFARGSINRDVPCDPRIYFTGDEVSFALRAHTHGYDLFHPHVVVAWHCYNRASRTPHWDDHSDWHARHTRSLRRVRRLFEGRLQDRFGHGRRRSIASYQARLLLPLVDDSGR